MSTQVLPPSVVRIIVPRLWQLESGAARQPTAKARLLSSTASPYRLDEVGLLCGSQFSPPSVLRRIVPKSPTTIAVLTSANATCCRWLVVPLAMVNQPLPPSVVRKIRPASPTASPLLASEKETPKRLSVAPAD